MKVLGIVPARYHSSRLPGKPLADICGKPMVWWVYQQALKCPKFDKVIVATDDTRIEDFCKSEKMEVMMTSPDGACLIDRLYEVSGRVQYDYYVSINGDEPLIEGEIIENVVPDFVNNDVPVVRGLMRNFTRPTDVIDPNNMKLVCTESGKLLLISRAPVPFPYKTAEYSYKKYVGVECYNKKALEFYANTPAGPIEKIEDLGTLRFIEHDVDVYYTLVESNSLSVDTKKDLEYVRGVIKQRLEKSNRGGAT